MAVYPPPDEEQVAALAAKQPVHEYFTLSERTARGKATRAELPRSAHGQWEPAPHRPDPVDLLTDQDKTRVPELVPIRYGRMLVSPFTFYRGAAAVMAADLADGPRTGLQAQLCGDAHLSNFGMFAAPDRRLTFGVNDFDETLPGPFEWDVKRLAASMTVAARNREFDAPTRARIVAETVRSYREAMREFATMTTLDLWYARIEVEGALERYRTRLTAADRKQLGRAVAKAWSKDSLRAFNKLTTVIDGEPRIIADPPVIVPIREMFGDLDPATAEAAIRGLIAEYVATLPDDRRHLIERYRFVDGARKVVGVGSVGTRSWVVLMLGRDGDDPLFMQAKEAGASVLEPYLGHSAYAHPGQRVVEGQRLMQAASDILLGWVTSTATGPARNYYVRQLWDAKGSVVVEQLDARTLQSYGGLCGWTLAKAHARSGDAAAIAAYLGSSTSFDRALVSFAEAYADQNERDYEALTEAVRSGRIVAESGV